MGKDFVDIWHGDILLDEPNQQHYWLCLSIAEQKKAASIKHKLLRKKYIYTRATLRKTLASYIDIDPQDLDIKASKYGKPFLSQGCIFFNISHTDNKLVIATSNMDNIGIDIEQHKNRKNLSGLVGKCFSKEEAAFWHSLPEKKKTEIFYSFWVKKEAFVKAVGKGISLGLDRCIINPENQTQFLTIPQGFGSVNHWKIIAINHEKNFPCALVIKAHDFKLEQKTISQLTKASCSSSKIT